MPASSSPELVTGPENNIDQLVLLTNRLAADVAIGGGYFAPEIVRAGVVGDGYRLALGGGMAVCLEEVKYSRLPQTPLKEVTEETRYRDIRMLSVLVTLYRASEGSKSTGTKGRIRLTNIGHVGSDFFPDLPSNPDTIGQPLSVAEGIDATLLGCELLPEKLHPNQLTDVCMHMANAILVDEVLVDAARRAGKDRELSGDPYKLLMAWSRFVQLGADVSAVRMPTPPRGLPPHVPIEPMSIAA